MALRTYEDDVLQLGRQREYTISDAGNGYSNIIENTEALQFVGSTFGKENAMGDMVLECSATASGSSVTIAHPSGIPNCFWFVAPKDYVKSDIYTFSGGLESTTLTMLDCSGMALNSGSWSSGAIVMILQQSGKAYLVGNYIPRPSYGMYVGNFTSADDGNFDTAGYITAIKNAGFWQIEYSFQIINNSHIGESTNYFQFGFDLNKISNVVGETVSLPHTVNTNPMGTWIPFSSTGTLNTAVFGVSGVIVPRTTGAVSRAQFARFYTGGGSTAGAWSATNSAFSNGNYGYGKFFLKGV